MSSPPRTLLVIDEDPGTARALRRVLAEWRCVSRSVGDAERADADAIDFDVVFAALMDPEERTHQLLRDLRARLPRAPVILLGTAGSGPAAAVRAGAFDYLRKPFEPDAVVLAVQRALEWRRLEIARQQLERAVSLLRDRAREADERDPSATPCHTLNCAVRERLSLRELEDRYVDAILALTGGNKVRAAEILGIDRRTLYRRGRRNQQADAGRAQTDEAERNPADRPER